MSWEAREMPDGWIISALTDIADIIMGQSPPGDTYNTEGQGLPFFQGKSEFGDDHPTVRKWCTAPTRIAEEGDILMSVRAPVGPTNIADQRCAVGRGLAIIRPKPGVPATLVRYGIKLQEDEIASWGTGTTFTAINKEHFQRIYIPLPPVGIRDQLAQVLEQAVALQRGVSTYLTNARPIIGRFRQAILAAACSGRLTAEWRGKNPATQSVEDALTKVKSKKVVKEVFNDLPLPDVPGSYVISTVGQASVLLEYGTSQRADASNDELPILRMGNIQNGQLELNDLKYIYMDSEIERLILQDGDLLFNRTNSPELVGKSAVFHAGKPMTFASYLIRVRFTPDVADPDFVNYWINSAWGKAWARLVKTDGVSQSNINGSKLAAMPIPLPPIEEQQEIVRRGSQMLQLAESLLKRIDVATHAIERSSQAVLVKAFRGELTATADDEQNAQLVK